MGLLKKFLSIGSKRFKKRSAVEHSVPPAQEYLKPPQVDDTEVAVGRLLRSSSGRCVAEPQIGLGSLPPLPHPIDSIIPLPKSSSTTIASVSARSTYSVTIHGRTVHSRTEFPNAYPPMDVIFTPKRSFTGSPRRRSKSVPITPRDKSRLLALRLDPSVASLLNHYDDEGHLDSALFSNTPSPQKEGRVQRRRTGSTLRQLLGHPSSSQLRNSSAEGDISWAEKFLGETDCNSSVSSLGPRTPADAHFALPHSIDDKIATPIECDTSATDHPTFSSLEVELSVSADLTHPRVPSSPYGDSTSSQRASQIFGFLGDKKRVYDNPVSRLPQLKTTSSHYRHFSAESPFSDTKHSHIPVLRRCDTHIPQPISPTSQRRYSLASDASRSPPSPAPAAILSPHLGDQSIQQPVIAQYTGQTSRSPHGVCPPSKTPSRQSTGPLSTSYEADDSYRAMECPGSILHEKSNIDNKNILTAARPREMQSQIPKLRSASGSSSGSTESKCDTAINSPRQHPLCLQPGVQVKPRATEAVFPPGIAHLGKENDGLSRLPQPATPVRPYVLHAHHLREAPSPASSSELSPVARQIMVNLRQQRVDARQRERRAGRLGSGQSRIRY